MYTTMLAFSYALDPPSNQKSLRTLAATVIFASGGIVGWPFALALSIPFILEEIFVYGGDRVPPELRISWTLGRIKRLIGAGVVASLIFVSSILHIFET